MLQLKNIKKVYVTSSENVQALRGVSISFRKTEFVSILGPSGCGKTTLLNIIGGLDHYTDGDLLISGRSTKSFGDRDWDVYRNHKVGFIFQSYNLIPHQTVLGNVELALTIAGLDKETRISKAKLALDRVGLANQYYKKPNQLSGGQCQRVAIARALVNQPKVLLLDEPLGALDLKLRKDMQVELKNIQKRMGITFIYVTHDQQEALSMSDTVVVMNDGRIQQIGSPIDIYNEPQNAFVADFIGESNILDGVMLDDFKAKFSGAVFQCLDKGFAVNESVDIVVRPEDVDVVPVEEGTISGTITSNTFKGVHFEMIVDIDNFKWMIQTTDYYPVGAKIGIQIEPDAIHVMKKSEYSGMYGDYSSFSDELERLSDVTEEEEE